MKKLFIAIILLLYDTTYLVAQKNNFYIDKIECRNKFASGKLVLNYKDDSLVKRSFAYSYDLGYFIGLNDSSKLLLIAELLKYENDTSRCCIEAASYSFNGIEGCRGKPKGVKHYTIQVDALFMINRLCWPKLMELYSCSPVLFDTKKKKEINSNPEKIKTVFMEYKKWFEACKLKNKIAKYFPFNDGRYVWYGGRKSIAIKEPQ